MFSQTVEYALRAMTVLTECAPRAKRTSEVAKNAKIPPAYLVKILQSLNKAGLVSSQRGITGGVALAKSPDEISILDVVDAVEPIKRIKTCPLGLPAHGTHLCPLHSKLDSALATVQSAFESTSLSEVIDKRAKAPCPFPAKTKAN